ncbi:MAG: hypothetical protein VYA86_04190 [Candidatus Thermoplasmatota archaeon]|nr:hypothetical protein [Candidatus Thermoplasmatota archaeon]
MRKFLTLFVFAILLLPSPVHAVPPVTISEQGILGGYMLDLEGVSNNSTSISAGGDMTGIQVVEVYTATWCINCVDSEHALMDALENESATVLVHHRSISESEDPFGTLEGDERWIELYGEASNESVGMARAPPSVVMDGTRMKVGSAADGESLQSDYAQMFADKHEYRSWNGIESYFTWTGDNSSGTLTWEFDTHPSEPEGISWTHRLMVVEHSAYFPDGGNGLEYYEDVVRVVIELDVTTNNDTAVGGQQMITLPDAWDGDDLSLVLVHEWNLPGDDSDSVDSGDEDGDLLPGFLAPRGLIARGAAALTRRD